MELTLFQCGLDLRIVCRESSLMSSSMAAETLAPLHTRIDSDALSTVSSATCDPPSSAHAVYFPDFLTGLLESVLSGVYELDSSLPADFCAALLRKDDLEATNKDKDEVFSGKGVPRYPLYKYLACALYEWISTGCLPRSVEPINGISEDEGKVEKIDTWTQRVVELGRSLVEICQGVTFQLHCQKPYISQLKDGSKSVEGRCASGVYTKIQVGDVVLFNQFLVLEVEGFKRYATFKEMLEYEGLNSVLPGVPSITEGVQVYRHFYSEATEKEAGVMGIHFRHPLNQRQPYHLLDGILKELGVEGVRALLGMRSTMGSIADTLPPPISSLLSAFSLVNDETVPGSKLTVGARALAKHVHRCSNGWWGKFTGTEPTKNGLSLVKVRKMIHDAIWMNVHVVPVPVFEIRVKDGYGARWTTDGSQFRGFLEPPMEEGSLHKWRH